MSTKINRALLQDFLSKGEGVVSVSSEAVDWIIAVAEEAAKNLAKSGRRTPGGRLMAPRMDAGLLVRHLTKAPDEIAGVKLEAQPERVVAQLEQQHEWGPREDWQTAVKRGETKLPFEEWKKEKDAK